ncbi:serine/threonine-protein kinase PknG [Pseudonocardia thermophila]|uniref:non-specific serine/threonine protein kinase n=1 Tax=Pseudonocardia thermophila TaxID=1848 RepID=A0A1M6ZFG7_PSETH|nr:serine/threonine-protein kinase [Pseudonocardia thermophila]SHL29246.1 serine/threonine-protein kinase PknG [Pseudonocardia thermophila]
MIEGQATQADLGGTAAHSPTARSELEASSRPSRRASGRSTGSTGRGRLGAGLVDVPPVPMRDPAGALLADPQVAEDKRFCSKCGGPVGRSEDGRPGPARGACPKDGTPFDFTPKLAPGTLVAGQYEVQGCLAHGGLGWIYLAIDRNVEDRWCVLKGLLDAGDADAMAAAVAEKKFLAQVSHPNIVSIFNFVQHPDEQGHPVGYIVMEYVGGRSLRQLLQDRRRPDGSYEPLPVGQAAAYALEMLPALGYLHGLGLVYCDFKPDNVIQYDRQVKLIDLGAVIRADDRRSAVFGTLGYQAPEIATHGPSVQSDIHTVGRTLAVLALGMNPTEDGRPTELPADHPVLVRHESFHRLLRRATDPDPLRRFASADEMHDQLAGVLREVLATEDGQPRPGVSTVFGPPRGTFAAGLLAGPDGLGRPDPARVAAALPIPLADGDDPAAAIVASADLDRAAVLRIVEATAEPSTELRLRLVRAHLEAGDPGAAHEVLARLAVEEPGDWRQDWWRGIAALVAGDPAAACARFDVVYSTLPGEIAPKLALAAAAECAGSDDLAGPFYTRVALTDPQIADAAFGRARAALRAGDRDGAIAALDAIPETSALHVAAQLAAVEAAMLVGAGEPELRACAARVERLPLDPATANRVRTTLLDAAIALRPAGGPRFLGCEWREPDLRAGLERCLRTWARLTTDRAERIALVDRANAVRPRTLT